MGSPEENKANTRRFIDEVFNRKNFDYAAGAIDESFVEHAPLPGLTPDKAGTIEQFRVLARGTPDIRYEIHDVIASGDRVAVRATYSGTDTGGFMPGMPATNKPYSMEGIDVVRWSNDGKVLEHWGIQDLPSAMVQLGLMPPPGGGD